jgi:hypothetical protein
MSKRKNTRPAPATQPLPRYEWPTSGADLPRLSWSAYLRLISLQLGEDYPGPVGRFLVSYLGALALQADALGATDPVAHERLAQAEQERESAWIQALEAEAADPGGSWEPTDDITGSLDGHDDSAHQYWIGSDLDDLTYRN